ncbi:hypothetical protein [Streptomyces mirabilis]|uniref:DUF7848 domain-containing protein n=1 Tax=Streptomyces mirabilis TaxID=68239 RepID=UPI0033EB68BB
MTNGLESYTYPEVRTRLELDKLPFRRWVECASCVEFKDIDHTDEAEEWAKDHNRQNRAHDRFRVVRQTGWRIAPGGEPLPELEPETS